MEDKGATNRLLPVTENDIYTVILNGKMIEIKSKGSISYERLCALAGYNPDHTPTAVYCLPNRGGNGTVTRGKYAPVVERAVYEVIITGAA